MQDILSTEKRSIRNISIDRPQTSSSAPEPKESSSQDSAFTPFTPRRSQKQRKWMRTAIWSAAALVAVVIIFLIIGSFFEGARVAITSRHALVNLNDSAIVSLSATDIPYEIVEVSKEESKEVAATGEERIERASSGTIVIYNDYSATAEKLIKNTRFQSADGKIFRIRDAVTVPGQKKDASGKTTPGSVEAEVFADTPGEEYNIGLTDFTVPAFKESNDPRFDKFYARSKTAMAGGFVGTVRTASTATTDSAKTELKGILEAGGGASLSSALPAGFVLLPDTIAVSFEDLPNADGATAETVKIRMKSVTRGLAIDGNALARYIADKRIESYEGEGVRFEDLQGLTVSLPTPVSVSDIPDSFEIRIAGAADLIWTYDVETLKTDLAGIHRNMTDAVFSRYPAIEKSNVTVRPFWARTLPDDPETIEIVEASND